MHNTRGIYAMMMAVAITVAALLAIGLMDRARDPDPIQQITRQTPSQEFHIIRIE